MVRNLLILAIFLMSIAQSYSQSLTVISDINIPINQQISFDINLQEQTNDKCCTEIKVTEKFHTSCQFDLKTTISTRYNCNKTSHIFDKIDSAQTLTQRSGQPSLRPPIL